MTVKMSEGERAEDKRRSLDSEDISIEYFSSLRGTNQFQPDFAQ